MIKQSIYVYCSNGQWQLLLLTTSKYRYVGICIIQLLMEFHVTLKIKMTDIPMKIKAHV